MCRCTVRYVHYKIIQCQVHGLPPCAVPELG
ncbi:Uncharacterised protein [Vibrio cholerae]|nr:Uncharacterised protein [Vibrio cholerae]